MTGLGFNGYDPKTGKTLWDRVTNIVIWDIETAQSFKVLFDSWNCRANVSDIALVLQPKCAETLVAV